jgi:hypothetical protein
MISGAVKIHHFLEAEEDYTDMEAYQLPGFLGQPIHLRALPARVL